MSAPRSVIQEIEQLREQLNRHSHLYYVLDSPEISDAEYDRLFDRLLALEHEYPETITPDSPTQKIGAEPSKAFGQVRHHVPMMSLQKVTTSEEFQEFHFRILRLLDGAIPTRH